MFDFWDLLLLAFSGLQQTGQSYPLLLQLLEHVTSLLGWLCSVLTNVGTHPMFRNFQYPGVSITTQSALLQLHARPSQWLRMENNTLLHIFWLQQLLEMFLQASKPPSSCNLKACKISNSWMKLNITISNGCTPTLLDYSCSSVSVPFKQKLGKYITEQLFLSRGFQWQQSQVRILFLFK